jgi:PAS domain S-box-containing protein
MLAPLGSSARVSLAIPEGDRVALLALSVDGHTSTESVRRSDESSQHVALRALDGSEGTGRFTDEFGQTVLAGFRFLPSVGWGLAIQVDRDDALSVVGRLAVELGILGTGLLLLAIVFGWALSRQVTSPLRSLADGVSQLGPAQWNIRRSVHTGDEVEALDTVMVDMAERLKQLYEHQEDLIAEKTSALEEEYALDHTMLECIRYGVIAVAETGVVTTVNSAAADLLGLPTTELVGKNVEDVLQMCEHRGLPLPGPHPVRVTLSTREAFRSSPTAHWGIQRANGAFMPAHLAVWPLIQGDNLFGALAVFQDMTEERHIDYLKSEFISLASHQLRTPMATIRWYLELLGEQNDNLTAEQKEFLTETERAARRMISLLGALLSAAKMEGADVTPSIEQFDVRPILEEAVQEGTERGHQTNVRVVGQLPKDPITITSDATLLRVVAQNFVSNAVKYSRPNSTVTLKLEVLPDGKRIDISVTDQGVGIPQKDQARIFEKFFRAQNVRQMDTDGNGLGLHITKSIIERLGGEIRFESTENIGTTFHAIVPMVSEATGTAVQTNTAS